MLESLGEANSYKEELNKTTGQTTDHIGMDGLEDNVLGRNVPKQSMHLYFCS